VVGDTVEQQEESLKPKDEKPKSLKGELERGESKKKIDEVRTDKDELEDEGKDKGEKKGEGKEDEDPSVSKVVETATSMQGKLGHRQNGGGANEGLPKGDDSNKRNCWDAGLYIVAQAGQLSKEIIADTAKKSDEAYSEFQNGENKQLMERESKEDKAFQRIC